MKEINDLGVPCFSGSCTEIYKEKCFKPFESIYNRTLPVAADMGSRSILFLIDPTIDTEKINSTIHAINAVSSQASQ